jgi:2-dehydro-3-deoxyphosphogluconate aldolase/(4S)-4-hydroxy-2-oxoglutarate aldolase
VSGAQHRLAVPSYLFDRGVIAIVRGSSTTHAMIVAETLVESGIEALEITLTVPGAIELISDLVARFGTTIAVGAGTVTSASAVDAAVAAGARFVVSPGSRADMVSRAVELEVPVVVGAWTPTEVLDAWLSGVSAVKLFPAGTGGIPHLSSLRDPYPDIPFIPSGGIPLATVGDFIAAGAVAVGLGGPLLGDALSGGSLDELSARATTALRAVELARTAK